MIDGNRSRLSLATENIIGDMNGLSTRAGGSKHVIPIEAMVTPLALEKGWLLNTIVKEVGKSIDVLKVDIDSFDCAVLQALVHQMDIGVIILESQPLAPPPLKFARMWHPEDNLQHGFYGCSLAYQLRILHPTYNLFVYTEDDTIFIHSRYAGTLERLIDEMPGMLVSWTSFPVHFPLDEIDCYRRSRALLSARKLEEDREEVPDFPVDIRREWALKLHPNEALTRLWSNLTATWECGAGSWPGEKGRAAEFYSLDL